MFRKISKNNIAPYIAVYPSGPYEIQPLSCKSAILEFRDNPTKDGLYRLYLLAKKKNPGVSNCISYMLGYTLSGDTLSKLSNHMARVVISRLPVDERGKLFLKKTAKAMSVDDMEIMYQNDSECRSDHKNQNQIQDTIRQLERIKLNGGIRDFIISTSSGKDLEWKGRINCAKSDGEITLNDGRIVVVFMRYGTTSGGSQTERHKSCLEEARKAVEGGYLMLQIMDGWECFLNYNTEHKALTAPGAEKFYSSTLWSTVKLLSHIDFGNFKFKGSFLNNIDVHIRDVCETTRNPFEPNSLWDDEPTKSTKPVNTEVDRYNV